eukprot:jgi/Ulvmu1/4361/UM002_0086.1
MLPAFIWRHGSLQNRCSVALIACAVASCHACDRPGSVRRVRSLKPVPEIKEAMTDADHTMLGGGVVLATSVTAVAWLVLRLISRFMENLNKQCIAECEGRTFEDPHQTKQIPVPSIHSEPSKTLTVIFPAYNESDRMNVAVDEALEFLSIKRKKDPKFSYEVIIVDDGSKDDTYTRAMEYVERCGIDMFRVLRLPVNRGKGAAVRAGMLAGRGELLLFADSDGATKFSDLDSLHARLQSLVNTQAGASKGSLFHTIADAHGMVVGSRAYLEHTEAVAQRHWIRNFLMHGFHFLVTLVAGPGVKDTQCGFKLFTRRSARILFQNMRLQRWCFDVELIYLAHRLQIAIAEENVTWHEIAGSKIRFWSIASMAFDLFIIKTAYLSGAWSVMGEASARNS